MFSAIPALGRKGPKRVDGVKLPKSSGNTLTRVAGTAAGLLGSMQGFFTSASPTTVGLDTIQCASFEDIAFDPKQPNQRTPSLIIGYHNGFQIWDLARAHQDSHTVHEVISKQWDAAVTIATAVQLFDEVRGPDEFEAERPFLALAASDGKSDGLSRGTLHLYSIPQGSFRAIPLHKPNEEYITEIASNGSFIAVGSSHHKIYLIDSLSLQTLHVVQCWQDPDPIHAPTFVLGARWLAFQSGTPLNGEIDSNVAKRTKKPVDEETVKEAKDSKKVPHQGAWSQKEVMALGYAGMREAVYLGSQLFTSVINTYSGEGTPPPQDKDAVPGSVEILSLTILRFSRERNPRIALFSADNRRIEKMAFDRSGLILATAADGGQSVKLWNAAHIVSSLVPNSPFAPMYVLERGTTLGQIADFSFTEDSSLVAFTTKPKGTTHIFPISLVGGEIGLSTHLPANIPDTLHVGEPITSAIQPAKLAAIHSPANPNTLFAGVSRLSAYPLTATHSDQKRANHAHDRTLYSFYPNGTLVRQDLALKADIAYQPPILAMITRPRHKWDLGRSTTGSLQFPTFKPSSEADHMFAPHENIVQPPNAGELLSNVETQTHAVLEGELGVPLPKFVIYAYTDLPQANNDPAKNWRKDANFSSLNTIKLHSPGLPGAVMKPSLANPAYGSNLSSGSVLSPVKVSQAANAVAAPSNPIAAPSNPIAAPSNPIAAPSNPIIAAPSNPIAAPSNANIVLPPSIVQPAPPQVAVQPSPQPSPQPVAPSSPSKAEPIAEPSAPRRDLPVEPVVAALPVPESDPYEAVPPQADPRPTGKSRKRSKSSMHNP